VARGAAPIAGVASVDVAWFARVGRPLAPDESALAGEYARLLGFPGTVDVIRDWAAAERLTRDPRSADGWWDREEAERRLLMRDATGKLGEEPVLEALTAAVEAETQRTHACATAAGGGEAMARVASGAALMALNQRALALLAGRGEEHLFVQKYALFASGRWPLGVRQTTLILF